MTSRRLAILVAIALVGGSTVAGVGLATQGSSKSRQVLQVDEVNGRVGQVVLGETRDNVIGTLGQPGVTGPRRPGVLVYHDLAVGLRRGRVVSITTSDPAAETEKVVRVGDPLSAARASYRKAAKCNPNSPDKTAKHPFCSIRVPAGRLDVVGDPIASMTLLRTR